ncbi:hypothetical protein BaRGS_00001531 [Batillaria attramentaria]|uniref:Uncharacterized protein n=1 Tax=Batillaria attramentaria TaxID=370345 RepID=A0ABD0M7F8_9CAEN
MLHRGCCNSAAQSLSFRCPPLTSPQRPFCAVFREADAVIWKYAFGNVSGKEKSRCTAKVWARDDMRHARNLVEMVAAT